MLNKQGVRLWWRWEEYVPTNQTDDEKSASRFEDNTKGHSQNASSASHWNDNDEWAH